MTHSNCDELLKITNDQVRIKADKLHSTLTHAIDGGKFEQASKELIGEKSTLRFVTETLNSFKDREMAALEIALVFDRKVQSFDETCTRQLNKIDTLRKENKRLTFENS